MLEYLIYVGKFLLWLTLDTILILVWAALIGFAVIGIVQGVKER